MGRLETQQRGDNVCILKGWNAILQQAASGYEMNNDKHSYYCWIEPKYNELRTALNFTARLRFGTFSNPSSFTKMQI